MRMRYPLLLTFVLSIALPPALAQEPITLRFEVVKGGSIVATPEVSVEAGSSGRIHVDGIGRLAFTPKVRGSGLVIAFDIRAGQKHLEPQLSINESEPGSISWTPAPDGQSFVIKVFWVR
jgi:hypothetical protein